MIYSEFLAFVVMSFNLLRFDYFRYALGYLVKCINSIAS